MKRIAIAALVAGGVLALPPAADALTVYAATSLTNVMPEIDGGATYSFGGSNTLQLQIERGAPADLFLSAGPKEAQALYRGGRCARPQTFATNKLVLIVPEGDPANVGSVYGLRKGGLKLSIGNPSVPIGDYTRRLLRRLRLSRVLETNTVSQQSNVGQVLSQVAFGGADAGFVYVTDARAQRDDGQAQEGDDQAHRERADGTRHQPRGGRPKPNRRSTRRPRVERSVRSRRRAPTVSAPLRRTTQPW